MMEKLLSLRGSATTEAIQNYNKDGLLRDFIARNDEVIVALIEQSEIKEKRLQLT